MPPEPHKPNEALERVDVHRPHDPQVKAVFTGDTERGIRYRVRKQAIKARGGETEVWEEHEIFWETPHRRVKDKI